VDNVSKVRVHVYCQNLNKSHIPVLPVDKGQKKPGVDSLKGILFVQHNFKHDMQRLPRIPSAKVTKSFQSSDEYARTQPQALQESSVSEGKTDCVLSRNFDFYPRDALQSRSLLSCGVRLSVSPSVTRR